MGFCYLHECRWDSDVIPVRVKEQGRKMRGPLKALKGFLGCSGLQCMSITGSFTGNYVFVTVFLDSSTEVATVGSMEISKNGWMICLMNNLTYGIPNILSKTKTPSIFPKLYLSST